VQVTGRSGPSAPPHNPACPRALRTGDGGGTVRFAVYYTMVRDLSRNSKSPSCWSLLAEQQRCPPIRVECTIAGLCCSAAALDALRVALHNTDRKRFQSHLHSNPTSNLTYVNRDTAHIRIDRRSRARRLGFTRSSRRPAAKRGCLGGLLALNPRSVRIRLTVPNPSRCRALLHRAGVPAHGVYRIRGTIQI